MKIPARFQALILAMLVITLTAVAAFAGGAAAAVRQQGAPPPLLPCANAAPPCLQDPQNVRLPNGQVIPLQQYINEQLAGPPGGFLPPPPGGQQGGNQQGGNQQGGNQQGGNQQGGNQQGGNQQGGNQQGGNQQGGNQQGGNQQGGNQQGGNQQGGGQQGDQQGTGPGQGPEASFFKRIFQLKIQLEDADGTDFDATFIKMLKGGDKRMRADLTDTLEGETFILHANKAKCFADGKDKGTAPEKVSCADLADEVANSAGSIDATITAKLTPDQKGTEWDAKKIVITGTSFNF